MSSASLSHWLEEISTLEDISSSANIDIRTFNDRALINAIHPHQKVLRDPYKALKVCPVVMWEDQDAESDDPAIDDTFRCVMVMPAQKVSVGGEWLDTYKLPLQTIRAPASRPTDDDLQDDHTTICEIATDGDSQDDHTTIYEISASMLMGMAGFRYEEFQEMRVELSGVYEDRTDSYDLGDYLLVVVLVVGDMQSRAFKDLDRVERKWMELTANQVLDLEPVQVAEPSIGREIILNLSPWAKLS